MKGKCKMGLFDKIKDTAKNLIDDAIKKLAYSEDDIAERKKKEGIVYVFDGGNGTLLEVYDDRVVLYHNKSLFGKFAAFVEQNVGEKTLYATDISSVEFKEAQKMCIGYIRFSVHIGSEIKKSVGDAAQDPNSVAIALVERNEQAAEIKKYLDQMLAKVRGSKSNSSTTIIQANSNAEELKKYKDLLDAGIITQEEFEAKKKQLLGL